MTITLLDIFNIDNLKDYKMHVARVNKEKENEQPLNALLSDNKDKWLEWNASRSGEILNNGRYINDFNRKYIISFANYKSQTSWLFGGIFEVINCPYTEPYEIKEVDIFKKHIREVKLNFKAPRPRSLKLENQIDKIEIIEK